MGHGRGSRGSCGLAESCERGLAPARRVPTLNLGRVGGGEVTWRSGPGHGCGRSLLWSRGRALEALGSAFAWPASRRLRASLLACVSLLTRASLVASRLSQRVSDSHG